MTDMNAALSTVEAENQRMMDEMVGDSYDIIVKNAYSGMTTSCLVYPKNTVGQVFDYCVDSLGLDVTSKDIFFVNEETHNSTTSAAMTIGDFGLHKGDVLAIVTKGKVAAM